ncbi:NAD(P)-dependent oxidoreductase, partial [Stenotrophomonas sp. GbtcB23]|uniref:NAD(P)-dependent oxidoreductase n=1 Tax=Stenotrophomonas sp. GbtcB23 TaxID=2824768 RepID=UPI0026726DB2
MTTPLTLEGVWPRARLIGREISVAVFALIGLGPIGATAVEKAMALGMMVMAFDPYAPADLPVWSHIARSESLDDILAHG